MPPLPRRCRWIGNTGKAVRLDEESAPGACSRRGWWVIGGPVRTPAPTPSLWIFAGGWYPPLRKRKNVGATAGAVPTFLVGYGRRGETKFRRKFFAKLSFKKAGLLFLKEK